MSFSVGIVGLPNVGKSTLFKALTKKPVDIADYPFTTIHPNVGVVQVPDLRLEKIAKVIKPSEKVTPTVIEFVDIAGLVKGAHRGEGLGNQFLAQIRNCDAILEVVREFEDPNVENVLGEINPEKEMEIIKIELLMKDLETIENLLPKIEKEIKRDKKLLKKFEILKEIKEAISREKLVSEINLSQEEGLEIKEYQFLTAKPIIYILNTNQKSQEKLAKSGEGSRLIVGGAAEGLRVNRVRLNLKFEEEISELSPKEKEGLGIEESRLDPQAKFSLGVDQVILACYNMLDLITFYTVAGGKEVRAWTLKKGLKAPQAGSVVHSDFEEKFIRAEVVFWQKLIEAGGWKKVKEKGWIQIVGRDYIVQDGEVIEFKI